jgi:hypothetical protein
MMKTSPYKNPDEAVNALVNQLGARPKRGSHHAGLEATQVLECSPSLRVWGTLDYLVRSRKARVLAIGPRTIEVAIF